MIAKTQLKPDTRLQKYYRFFIKLPTSGIGHICPVFTADSKNIQKSNFSSLSHLETFEVDIPNECYNPASQPWCKLEIYSVEEAEIANPFYSVSFHSIPFFSNLQYEPENESFWSKIESFWSKIDPVVWMILAVSTYAILSLVLCVCACVCPCVCPPCNHMEEAKRKSKKDATTGKVLLFVERLSTILEIRIAPR